MKAITVVSGAALFLAGCNAARAEGPQLLSQLGGKQDNAVMAEIQARNAGSLCSLVTSDGHARLMSFGRQAVVDIGGKPRVLSYHPGPRDNQASFTGAGVRVSGDLTRQRVTGLGKTVSHPVDVRIDASGRVGDRPAFAKASAGSLRLNVLAGSPAVTLAKAGGRDRD